MTVRQMVMVGFLQAQRGQRVYKDTKDLAEARGRDPDTSVKSKSRSIGPPSSFPKTPARRS
jgi:hypothetical protein